MPTPRSRPPATTRACGSSAAAPDHPATVRKLRDRAQSAEMRETVNSCALLRAGIRVRGRHEARSGRSGLRRRQWGPDRRARWCDPARGRPRPPARPVRRSRPGLSGSSAVGSRKSYDTCTVSSSGRYACPVDTARSQPWMTNSLKATRPMTSAGQVTPPAVVSPAQASGNCHAPARRPARSGSARASHRAGGPRSAVGVARRCGALVFVAARVNSMESPRMCSSSTATVIPGHGVGPGNWSSVTSMTSAVTCRAG